MQIEAPPLFTCATFTLDSFLAIGTGWVEEQWMMLKAAANRNADSPTSEQVEVSFIICQNLSLLELANKMISNSKKKKLDAESGIF